LIAIRNFFYKKKCYDFQELFSLEVWHETPWPKTFLPEDLKFILQERLNIVVPDNYQQVFPTPMALCREIAYVNLLMNLENEEPLNEWDIRYNSKIYYPSPFPGI